MICYPKGVSDIEIEALNDYWITDTSSHSGFKFSIKSIDENYKPKGSRSISYLAQRSSFGPNSNNFFCSDCKKKAPVKNRTSYINRTQSDQKIICGTCISARKERAVNDARAILENYKEENFRAWPYVENINTEEALALLCITSSNQKGGFITDNPGELVITGIKSLDQKLLISLIDKKALTLIRDLPVNVERASKLLYGDYNHISYDRRSGRHIKYSNPESIARGLYLNALYLNSGIEVTGSDISTILYQKIQTEAVSLESVSSIKQTIKDIQTNKLFGLVMEVSDEYRVPIDNSNPLRALLDHLAEHYQPQNLFYTFRVKARNTAAFIHKDSAPHYIAKHYFTKSVGNFIQHIENKGSDLEKVWTLPTSIETSPFEALFSQLYLHGHFNWHKLSAKEIVARWLDNVKLAESALRVLSDETTQ